ncbi:MAG: TetR/AcrR family transcriptional regulator [Candidatus Odinarchaeota archaeon]
MTNSKHVKTSKKDRRVRKTHNAIYSAAARLFNEEEYTKITMEQIAEQADISRTTLYTYFKSKQEIYFKMGCDRFKIVNDQLIDITKAPMTGFETIVVLCAELLENIRKNPMYNRIIFLLLSNSNLLTVERILDGEIAPKEAQELLESWEIQKMVDYLEQIRIFENYWAKIVEKGINDGSITTDLEPIQLVHYLFMIINGLLDQVVLKQHVLERFRLPDDKIFEKTMDVIKKLLNDS